MSSVNKKQGSSVDILLNSLINAGGSDLHLSVGKPPVYRLHGQLVPIPGFENKKMTPSFTDYVSKYVIEQTYENEEKKKQVKNKLKEERSVDLAYTLKNEKGSFVARFRVNIFHSMDTISLVLRTIPIEIPRFTQLGLPSVMVEFTRHTKGLILITGPTGSGKSTTLAALLDIINEEKAVHIVTVEDPIEFVHSKNKKGLVSQREVGIDTNDFKSALKDSLREDPDVILIGEIRDRETAQVAMEAAETGHLVFATLHTSSAKDTIERVISMFGEKEQAHVRSAFSSILVATVGQILLKKRNGKGRVAATEILIANNAVKAIIREGKDEQINSQIETNREIGSRTFNTSLVELVQKGIVKEQDAIEMSLQKDDLRDKLKTKRGLEIRAESTSYVLKNEEGKKNER